MKVAVIETVKGSIAHCTFQENPAIKSTSDFLDILANSATSTIAINKESLTHSFFELKTGIAGEFLQKISNYRKKLIIIGDFSAITSQSLQCFISESNRGGTVLFVPDIESGVKLLT
jgi:hypothetical protein